MGAGAGMGKGRGGKGKCAKIARKIVIGINAVFLGLGILVLILALVALTKAEDLTELPVLGSLDLDLITFLLVVSGSGSIGASLCGFFGALKKIRKLLTAYVVLLGIIVSIQIGMGAWLSTVNVDGDSYEDKFQRRAEGERSCPEDAKCISDYYEFFDCCYWSDVDSPPNDEAIGVLCTKETFTFPGDLCQTKTNKYIDTNMRPAALAAVGVGAVELAGLVLSCFVIFQNQGENDDFYDSPFHY